MLQLLMAWISVEMIVGGSLLLGYVIWGWPKRVVDLYQPKTVVSRPRKTRAPRPTPKPNPVIGGVYRLPEIPGSEVKILDFDDKTMTVVIQVKLPPGATLKNVERSMGKRSSTIKVNYTLEEERLSWKWKTSGKPVSRDFQRQIVIEDLEISQGESPPDRNS